MADPSSLKFRQGGTFHGRYRVERSIRAGGMGAVYEVLDLKTDTPRALKVMLPDAEADPDMRARFEREASVTGRIQSEHLVRVTDAGVDAETEMPFLVMELLQGEDLDTRIKRAGPLSAEQTVQYLWQAALALDKTHAAGVVHRDLKPPNLFLTFRDDGSPCVKILDFGIARRLSQTTTTTQGFLGTPAYMAPEQMRGRKNVGPPADVFALGHTAYTLLVGEQYWKEESLEHELFVSFVWVMMEGMREPPTARAQRRRGVTLPEAFDAWMAKVTAATPQDRFGSATAAIAGLASALAVALPAGASVGATPLPAPSSPSAEPSPSERSALSTHSSFTAPGDAAEPDAGTQSPLSRTRRPEPAARSPARRAVLSAAVIVALGLGAVLLLRPFLRATDGAPSESNASSAAAAAPPGKNPLIEASPEPSLAQAPSVSAATPSVSSAAPPGVTAAAPSAAASASSASTTTSSVAAPQPLGPKKAPLPPLPPTSDTTKPSNAQPAPTEKPKREGML